MRLLAPAAALSSAGLLGAGLALAGAAALGAFEHSTTTVREVSAPSAARVAAAFSDRGDKRLTIGQVFRLDAPGVVQVTSTSVVTTQPDPFGFGFPQQQTERALGSGFVIDTAGHVVTNYHVIANARSIQVSFSNNENVKARLVGSDPSTDVAVLQVPVRSRALTPLALGDSDKVRVGDSVVAIGNPLGYNRSITAGIVSGLQRAITAPNQYEIDHIIQTDAPINHGNSGGPLINSLGQVIGVNAQIATGDSGSSGNIGIGFAIPINTVKNVVAQLIEKGKVEHAFLGVTVKQVTPTIAHLFRLPAKHGLLVASVQNGSGAAAAGLRPGRQQVTVSGESYPLGGDLLVAADSVPLESLSQLRDVIAAKKPGDRISLQIYRGDSKQTLDAKLGRQPTSPRG